MSNSSLSAIQSEAVDVHALVQGLDALVSSNTDRLHTAIVPLLDVLTEKTRSIADALDNLDLTAPKPPAKAAPTPSGHGDALHTATLMQGMIEAAFNADNEGRGNEVTSLLTVLSDKAHELTSALDRPTTKLAAE